MCGNICLVGIIKLGAIQAKSSTRFECLEKSTSTVRYSLHERGGVKGTLPILRFNWGDFPVAQTFCT